MQNKWTDKPKKYRKKSSPTRREPAAAILPLKTSSRGPINAEAHKKPSKGRVSNLPIADRTEVKAPWQSLRTLLSKRPLPRDKASVFVVAWLHKERVSRSCRNGMAKSQLIRVNNKILRCWPFYYCYIPYMTIMTMKNSLLSKKKKEKKIQLCCCN